MADYGQVMYRQDGLIEQVYTSNTEPLHAELEHFVQCVRGGNQPSVGGAQALKALRLASEIDQMALDGTAWKSPADLRMALDPLAPPVPISR